MGPVFAELEAPEKDLQNGDFHPELEIEINRARIRINRDTPEQFLLQAIHVLKYMSPILRVKECRGGCFLSLSACQSKEKKHLAVITIP